MKNNKLKNDIILILALLTAAGLIFLAQKIAEKPGVYVQVEIDGEAIDTFPLDVDFEKRYDFTDGSYNILFIKNGSVEIIDAGCPDKLCVHHKSVKYDGESIICLPNKLVVTVTGGKQSGLDAVAG